MEYFNINNKEYKLVIGNGTDYKYRESFNALSEKTFGFNFEKWYQGGYWKKQYIPYSLMDGDDVVSNVSVNIMDVEVFGKIKRYIQLGTVMTDVNYRKQGLLRAIMDRVILDWKDKGDLLYLFANNSALNFYQRFGFSKIEQYQCTKSISKKDKLGAAKKLNMSDEGDRTLVYNKANIIAPFSEIYMCGNAELIMFYCTMFMSDNVYYIKDYDAVVIVNFVEDTIEIFDVFCEKGVSVDSLLDYLINEDIKKVKLYFTPKDTSSYMEMPLVGEDTLFVLGEDKLFLEKNQFMFPELSHT
ncbi:GNAT family N-acetyltransferase [Clostridium saccharoperbutylacetonicum]|uniref:GNAT family N-acetyltransferase n=1 Tax=Clostridium saccharoperbutylacetonicum TaxID=36745 RepID=UPI0039ECD8EB